MRRLVVVARTGLTVVLIALSFHTLSNAMVIDEGQSLSSLISSPIDPPSTITGVVFEDGNGNGEQDAGEPGIPGVTVHLENGISGTMTTDPSGSYWFSLAWSGPYTVTATTPTGYTNTTPEEVATQVTGPGQQVTIDFGYRGIGTIRGTVFDDRNSNGSQEEGEPGVGGATVKLLQGGSVISTTPTGADGTYAFASVFLGAYTVEETNPPGYIDTTPNSRAVAVTAPGEEKTVDFGDYGLARVTGVVFNDLDGDGARDAAERGIPGVTVQLLRDATAEFTATTDSNGVYFLLWDDLGDYTVKETDLEGYVSTSPNQVEISKTSPNQVETVHFADRGIGIIHGTVFHDQNGNQVPDMGEPGIDGVTITLLDDDAVARHATTAGGGHYEFVALGLGDYTVEEIDPDGYNSTTPNVLTASLMITRQVAAVNFGDRGIGTIQGTVFDDENGDQERNPGEVGISGVTITLLQGESTISATTTTSEGVYEFDSVWLGEYTVRETDREGYVSTTDNTETVSLVTPKQVAVRNFGDRGVGAIRGTVFDDRNGDATQSGAEPGLAGVTITLLLDGSPVSTTVTASDGTYAFTSLFLGNYTVQEADPEGYNSTTPNDVEVFITRAGQERTVDFGDRGIGAIQGVVYEDENENGEQDAGETGIDGVPITLLSAGSVVSTTTTGGGGTYRFDPVWLGAYTVVETDPNGYMSTTPNEVTASLTVTQRVTVVDFGDRSLFAIYLPIVAGTLP